MQTQKAIGTGDSAIGGGAIAFRRPGIVRLLCCLGAIGVVGLSWDHVPHLLQVPLAAVNAIAGVQLMVAVILLLDPEAAAPQASGTGDSAIGGGDADQLGPWLGPLTGGRI